MVQSIVEKVFLSPLEDPGLGLKEFQHTVHTLTPWRLQIQWNTYLYHSPVVVEYLPVPHVWQLDAPVAVEYLSAPHNPPHPWTPAVAEYVSPPQSVQTETPVVEEYWYTPHSVQSDLPLLEYWSAPQNPVHVVESEPEYVPNPQSTQCLKSTVTTTVEYLPEVQGWHVGPPYCPVSQKLHFTNPVPHTKNKVDMKLGIVRYIVSGHNDHEY